MALTGTPDSPLGRRCGLVLNSHVEVNPSPVPEAPTTSTTSALAAGTAAAMIVSHYFPYPKSDFYNDHPNLEHLDDITAFNGVTPDRSFDVIAKTRDIFAHFAASIEALRDDPEFSAQMLALIDNILVSHCASRPVFFSGAGSSLRISEKIAATLTSVGIEAVALNPAQLVHGGCARIRPDDLLIAISFSGETHQLIHICRLADARGARTVGITSREPSSLLDVVNAGYVIAGKDADDSKLVPVPDQKILSSFINLAVGDTLAVMLARITHTTQSGFQIGHPGGEIGRQNSTYSAELLSNLSDDNIKAICDPRNQQTEEVREELLRLLRTDLAGLGSARTHDEFCILEKELTSFKRRQVNRDVSEIIVIGMGSIGMGYLAHIFDGLGMTLHFVERDMERVASFRKHPCSKYSIRFCGKHEKRCGKKISGFTVSHSSEIGKISALALRIDHVFVAVGVANLEALIPTIAFVVNRRYAYGIEQPINFVFNENFPISQEPLAGFRQKIRQCLTPDLQVYFDEYVGLNPAVDEATVPSIVHGDDELRLEASLPPLHIDVSNWRSAGSVGPPDWGENVKFTDCLLPRHLRKLWVHNMGHALTGYLGHYRGHKFIHEAIRDEQIQEVVRGAMKSIAEQIFRRWSSEATSRKILVDYVEWRLAAYDNTELEDTVARVCRDPLRKLDKMDRLVGPINYVWKYGDSSENIASDVVVGLVAAMHYAVDMGCTKKSYQELRGEVLERIDIDSEHVLQAERKFEALTLLPETGPDYALAGQGLGHAIRHARE